MGYESITCLLWQERKLQNACQEKGSSPSSHQKVGAQATETNARLEKEEASDHIYGQGQRKRGTSRGARPLQWSRTRPFVDVRGESNL